jgi:hypothetical protein
MLLHIARHCSMLFPKSTSLPKSEFMSSICKPKYKSKCRIEALYNQIVILTAGFEVCLIPTVADIPMVEARQVGGQRGARAPLCSTAAVGGRPLGGQTARAHLCSTPAGYEPAAGMADGEAVGGIKGMGRAPSSLHPQGKKGGWAPNTDRWTFAYLRLVYEH